MNMRGTVMGFCLVFLWCVCGASIVLASSLSYAACPIDGSPDVHVCTYSGAVLAPRLGGSIYMDLDQTKSPLWGATLGLDLFTWSDNTPTFGPSQGSFFVEALLFSDGHDFGATSWFVRGGVVASLEFNASRDWLIPYYALTAGYGFLGEYSGALLAEPRVGLYVVRWHRFGVGLDGGYGFFYKEGMWTSRLSATAYVSASFF